MSSRGYGKEVIILKSSISKEVFQEFVSSYQTCTNSPTKNNHATSVGSEPFVYVDAEGNIRLVTNVVDSVGGNDEIFALSVAEDGFMEFLSF